MTYHPDKTYKSIWTSYIAFVDLSRRNGDLPPGPKYLTPQNVDYYYKKFIAVSKNSPKTVKKTRAALQYYINSVEYIDDIPRRFKVDSPAIDEALLLQQRRYNENSRVSTVDPHHKIPTNTLSNEDHIEAMRKLFSNNNFPYWKSMSLSWTLGTACFFRPDTFLKLRLSNLYLDTRHIPPQGDEFTVSYILFPSDLKGGQYSGKKLRVAGSWRHRDYRRCAVGYLSMILFVSLRNDNTLNFYVGENGRRPPWWDRRITDEWKDSSTLCHTYRRFLDYCGIDHNKYSYIRTSGIDEAGFEGELFQDQIGTMSKHTTHNTKLDVFYMTELYPPVLRTLAGFKPGETYSVPRTEVNLDLGGGQELVSLVFPRINVWRSQIQSRNGDKSKAATNFIGLLLPAIAKVVVQDGIYWVRDFPNHFVTRFLLGCMPSNYELWAKEKREWVDTLQAKRSQATVANLNVAAQAIVRTLQHDFNLFKNQITDSHTSTYNILTEVKDILLDMPKSQEQLVQSPYCSCADSKSASRKENHIFVLRNTPLLPVLPTHLPKTIEQVLDQHIAYKLRDWDNKPMHGLPLNERMALGRRRYLFDEILRRALVINGEDIEQVLKMRQAAKIMDDERKLHCLSVSQYLEKLKSLDSSRKKRKRSETDDN